MKQIINLVEITIGHLATAILIYLFLTAAPYFGAFFSSALIASFAYGQINKNKAIVLFLILFGLLLYTQLNFILTPQELIEFSNRETFL